MLRVVHGNRLDALAGALAEACVGGDPFTPTTIIVSGNLVARWVTFALAGARGIAAHLDLPFLEPFVERVWTTDAAGREARLAAMDRRKLAALVASVLADRDVLADDALQPVREYLHDDDAGARQVRRVQLADRVAGLVWEYALTRGEWLDAWEAGKLDAPAGSDATTWAWQARLVRAIALAAERIHAAGGPRWSATPRLPRARRRLGLAAPSTAPVHVVGFSFLAPAYLDALGELGARADVTVYQQDPCAELWDDVRRKAAADDPRALTLWGRPARDTIARLLELTDGFEDRFVEPGAATALAALRTDILHRSSGPPPGAAPGRLASLDARPSASALPLSAAQSAGPPAGAKPPGVTILACPSLTRELEIVGSEIRALLDRDPTLRANQIAVLAAGPDADRYLAQLPAVWQPLALAHHLVDAPLAEHGRVAEAALLLLELPLGRFARPELLRFMTHPAVLARHRHVDPEDWVEWAERLGIVHGADAADHAGTYLADVGPRFHWDQGIKRLALGAFMDPADAPAGVAFGDGTYLPEPIAADQQASAATFALLARSLIGDAAWLREAEAPLARWAEILDAMIATYVAARDEVAGRELAQVRAELAKLAGLDLDGRALRYAEVVEIARRSIGALRGDRGGVLAHGVMVAPLAPGRALPARYTFVVGAGEGAVPDTTPRSPLDLRGAEIKRGDVSRGDRDRYAFLECVLAPDDALVVSYVARDLETGDPLAPSSLVLELEEMLAPYGGAAKVEHPLHRWDARYDDAARTPSRAPGAVRERRAAELRAHLTGALAARGVAVPDAPALAALLAAAPVPRLRHALRLGAAADLIDRVHDRDPVITLSLGAVRRFLETPAQAWAQVVLRLDDGDAEDLVEREDEPFVTPAHERAVFLREVFARHLGADGAPPAAIEDAYRAAAAARTLAGRAPVGVFGAVEHDRDVELLRRWSREVAARGGASSWQRYGFGRSAGAGCARHAPIALEVTLDGRASAVELIGITELVGGAIGSLVLQPGKGGERHALRGMFDAAILAATGIAEAHAHLVLDREGAKAARHRPWARSDARAWLRGLVEELLGAPHAYLLSLNNVKQLRDGKPTTIEKPSEDTPGAIGYGPLRRGDELAIPRDAAAIVARRHGPIYDRVTEVSS